MPNYSVHLIDEEELKTNASIEFLCTVFVLYRRQFFHDFLKLRNYPDINSFYERILECLPYVWFIREGSEIAGAVVLTEPTFNAGESRYSGSIYSGDVLVAFRRKYWGSPIVVESCRNILTQLFEFYGLYRLGVTINTQNTPPKALAKTLGFKKEGILRGLRCIDGRPQNQEVWSMLRPEYFDRKKNELRTNQGIQTATENEGPGAAGIHPPE